jgi:hypothetical protein
MNEEKRRKIEILAAIAHEKRTRWVNLGMINTPSDPNEREKTSVAYAVSRAEMIEATRLLEEAMYS